VAPILAVADLAIAFPDGDGWRRVVDGVTLEVAEGEVVGLVGESGCGKTLTALALLGLVPEPGRVIAGSVHVAGADVATAGERELSSLRGGTIGFVFQEPAQALNPVRTVGFQVAEAARIHQRLPRRRAARLAVDLLREVGLEDAEAMAAAYPHQLSGGQRQRVLLACALSANPRVLVADEPTSALDTVAQQQFAELLATLHRRRGLAFLVISHDLALVARLAERVVVLYAGETVEMAAREAIVARPLHPYSRALMRVAGDAGAGGGERFATIPGTVPRAGEWERGCRFAPRCPLVIARCRDAHPTLDSRQDGRRARCFVVAEAEGRVGDS